MIAHSDDSARQEHSIRLPAKVIVSLRAGVVLAIANIICVLIFAAAWKTVHAEAKSIQVTGSARKAIDSDLIVFSARVSSSDPDLTHAYELLKTSVDKTLAFLKSQSINESQIKTSAVETFKRRAHDDKGHETEKVVSYELSQAIEITSTDVAHVADVGRQITELIKDGVVIESNAPRYIYTKLGDLKIAMLAEATKDATARAQQIAGNSGAKLGSVMDAHMGVMQINPIHTYDASGAGQNDTSSFAKEITAVVTARFALE